MPKDSSQKEIDDNSLGHATHKSQSLKWIVVASAIALVIALGAYLWVGNRGDRRSESQTEHTDVYSEESNEVELSPEAVMATSIETVSVAEHPAVALLRVTGTVEADQQQTQQVTPLVSGRVERVHVVLGDSVRAGATLAVISSPEVAEMHGKLHEAETRLMLAEQNLVRVQKAENRAAVLQAKARLDQAEATLRRTQKLIELGAGAGKDLVAAETEYKTAKAEYDYQSNITINREVQMVRAEVETSRVEVSHLRNSLRALGAAVEDDTHTSRHDISTVALVAPVSGRVTERLVNAGAGIEAGKPLFTISNISSVWVIANVPEAQVGLLQTRAKAEVRVASIDQGSIVGEITYIDPILNEETRTARVRIEVANTREQLKVGMFVEVAFETGAARSQSTAYELVIPDEAIQRIGERVVVFMPKEGEPGHFEVRDIEIGSVVDGQRQVRSGLHSGDRVVTKGSFTLKTQLLKNRMGGHGHG